MKLNLVVLSTISCLSLCAAQMVTSIIASTSTPFPAIAEASAASSPAPVQSPYDKSMSWQDEYRRLSSTIAKARTSNSDDRDLLTYQVDIFEHACQIGLHSKTPLSTNWENDTVTSTTTSFCRGEFQKLHESSTKADEGKYPLNYGGQRSGLLKIESKLVWIGCAMASITTPQEWEVWRAAEIAGKILDRIKEEEERKKKEADEHKTKAPASSPPSDKPLKSKFPGWAGLLVGVVVGCLICGVCSCCIGRRITKVVCPECKGTEEGIGMDDLERGGGAVEGTVVEEALGLVEGESETASLPPYEEVEK